MVWLNGQGKVKHKWGKDGEIFGSVAALLSSDDKHRFFILSFRILYIHVLHMCS